MITGPNLVSGHEYHLIPVPAPQAGGARLFVSSRFLLQNILKAKWRISFSPPVDLEQQPRETLGIFFYHFNINLLKCYVIGVFGLSTNVILFQTLVSVPIDKRILHILLCFTET